MSSATRRVLFLTGTRADYGKLKPLIERIESDDRFDCRIFATGMHMLARYGYTLDEILKAQYRNVFTYINQIETGNAQMDLVLANTIQGLGYYVRECRPDLMVVHGDRVETLAGAIVGALNNILVAHVEGGELSGTVDEVIRHSVSKLAHLHFVANEEAATRLRQMGELPETIHVIGSPEIDIMLSDSLPTIDETRERYGIPFEDYAIFTYHPVTTESASLRQNVAVVTDALLQSGRNFVVIYPNNDTGSDVILDRLQELRSNPRFRLLPSLRFEHFLTLLKCAQAIVGNSSAGVREAPVYGVPTVNIGSRQMNRFEYSSIVNVAEDADAILEALRALPTRHAPSLHFGNGESADAFVRALELPVLWETRAQKRFKDLGLAPASAGNE